MKLSQVGELTVNQRAEGGENAVLWQRSGSQGQKWIKATVQIPVSPASYDLVIEGSMGVPDVRGIAIDDIVLVPHACPVDEAVFCNFEADLCTFKNTESIEWKRAKAKDAGVVRDHTTGSPNGHLAFLDLSAGNGNNHGIMDGSLHSGGRSVSLIYLYDIFQVAEKPAFIHISFWQVPQ